MAGKRMLHANICDSEKLATISYEAETLYYRLLTRVDDNGNFTANPRLVYGQCLALRDDMNPARVDELLGELASVTGKDKKPLIQMYDADGDTWLHITKFEDFQHLRSDRLAAVKYPTHPQEFGPTAPKTQEILEKQGVVTKSQPVVNQRYTSGIPTVGVGLRKISKDKIGEEKSSQASSNTAPDWTTLSVLYRRILRKRASANSKNKQRYQEACEKFGEDRVLKIFEEWAEQGKERLRNTNEPLYFFFQDLPEMVEVDDRVAETEKPVEPELSEAEAEKIVASSVSERQKEASEQLQKIADQKKWDEKHRDEI